MTTIHAPSNYTGTSYIGPLILTFTDGVAKYDGELNDGVRQYLASMGYGIGKAAVTPEPAPRLTDLYGNPAPDARDLAKVQVGSDLRDAAVDPHDTDFLPPIHAGTADPHGDLVVAPGIHALSGPKPIHPGPVGRSGDTSTPDTPDDPNVVKDTDTQAANESALAEAVLVDRTPVPAATAAAAQVDPVNADAAGTPGVFDPGAHTVTEVNAYLANAGDTERQRVLEAEAAGKNRSTVTS